MAFSQKLSYEHLMTLMNKDYGQINDMLTQKNYIFLGKDELLYENNRFVSKTYKWEYKPVPFNRSKCRKLVLNIFHEYPKPILDKYQKSITYRVFSNLEYIQLLKIFKEKGFKRVSTNTELDDDGGSIIKVLYIKGDIELTTYTFINGQYEISLMKWSSL
jgi:hypothetical protein